MRIFITQRQASVATTSFARFPESWPALAVLIVGLLALLWAATNSEAAPKLCPNPIAASAIRHAQD